MRFPSLLTLGTCKVFMAGLLRLPTQWLSTLPGDQSPYYDGSQHVNNLVAYSVLLQPGTLDSHIQTVEAYIQQQGSKSEIYFKDDFKNPRFYLAQFDDDLFKFVEAQKDTIEIVTSPGRPLTSATAVIRNNSVDSSSTTTTTSAPWNLAFLSVDQSDEDKPDLSVNGYLGGSSFDQLDWRYEYPSTAGKGVVIYVIDTGVRSGHSELGKRVLERVVAKDRSYTPEADELSDNGGHGTMVAVIAAGSKLGIAKAASVVSIKVEDSHGGTPNLNIQGIVSAVKLHKEKYGPAGRKGVINISRILDRFQIYEYLINQAIENGMHVVHASGNDYKNMCHQRVKAVGQITVGATNSADQRAAFSNYGPCVDIYAPGEEVITSLASNSHSKESGTSYAAPHVAGIVALWLAEHPADSPKDVKKVLTDCARKTTGGVKERPFVTPMCLFGTRTP